MIFVFGAVLPLVEVFFSAIGEYYFLADRAAVRGFTFVHRQRAADREVDVAGGNVF